MNSAARKRESTDRCSDSRRHLRSTYVKKQPALPNELAEYSQYETKFTDEKPEVSKCKHQLG